MSSTATVGVGGSLGRAILPTGAVDIALDLLFPPPNPHKTNPSLWVKEKLGRFVWSGQVEILDSLFENKYTAVKACHGPGKSFTASCAGAWWLDPDVHELGSAFVISTAPSWPQVDAILWRELRRRKREASMPGRITSECMWYMGEGRGEEELIAMGRKPQDYDQHAFQGIHARYLLVIVDEACGIPEMLWNAINSLVTNDFARVLAIGNPDDPTSKFADYCKPGSGWNVITIPAFSTPNFTGEWIPEEIRDDLVTPAWVEEREREWGIGSPLYTSKVLAEFPEVTDDTLFPPALLERACKNELAGIAPGRYGADIARMGDDESCLYRNRGGQIRLVKRWHKMDTMESAGQIAAQLNLHGPSRVPAIIDSIGVGAGVYDRLREQRYPVGGFQGSQKAFNTDRYANRRAEVYWEFKDGLEKELFDLDADDLKLMKQLSEIKYHLNSRGQIVIESKEDMKARGLPSPDRADACIYTTVRMGSMSLAGSTSTVAGDLMRKKM